MTSWAKDCEKYDAGSEEYSVCLVDTQANALNLMNLEVQAAIKRLSGNYSEMELSLIEERLESAQVRWSEFKESECNLKAAIELKKTEKESYFDCSIDLVNKRTQELQKLTVIQ